MRYLNRLVTMFVNSNLDTKFLIGACVFLLYTVSHVTYVIITDGGL